MFSRPLLFLFPHLVQTLSHGRLLSGQIPDDFHCLEVFGVGYAAKPKKRSEPKNAEPPAAAPKRGRRNSAGDEGAQIAKPKSKVARQNS